MVSGTQTNTLMQDIPGNKTKDQHKANDDAVGHTDIDVRYTQKAVTESVDHIQHWIDF